MDNLERYQNLVRIGRGTYGTVYKADDIGANPPCPVAIKIVTGLAESLPCFLVREISMLKSLQHPNIVQLRHLFHASGSFYLVFEAMAMDLHEYISRNPRGLSRDLAQSYMAQLLLALAHMHQCGFIHRDLKPANLLIDADGNLKLADFGLAREELYDHVHTPELVTLWYRPMEIILGADEYTTAVDVWSAGCIYAEMLTGSSPFQGNDNFVMIESITTVLGCPTAEEWPALPSLPHCDLLEGNNRPLSPFSHSFHLNAEDAHLLNALVRYNPDERMTAEDAVNLPMFDLVRAYDE